MKYQFLSILVALSLLLIGCGGSSGVPVAATELPVVKAETAVLAEGRVEPLAYAEIAFPASGVISEVLVEEGEEVQKGTPLIRLGGESDTNYAAAQLDLVSAQQALNDLKGSSGKELAQTVIDLKDAQEAHKKAENYLHYLQTAQRIPQTENRLFLIQTWKGYEYRTKTRNFKGPAPQDWIIEAENDLALKKARLDELQRAYDRLKDGVDSEQLALLEAKLNAAKARVASFAVVAPFDGLVASLPAHLGSSINAGETAVTIADCSSWLITTKDVTEIDVVKLKEGQPVTVTLDALPGVELQGTILSLGETYAENQGDVVYEVTVVLTETDPAMRWGMTAVVKFE